jgi:hypothetical protein
MGDLTRDVCWSGTIGNLLVVFRHPKTADILPYCDLPLRYNISFCHSVAVGSLEFALGEAELENRKNYIPLDVLYNTVSSRK